MKGGLAFDRAPAIDIPLRFLLVAPLLAVPIAGLLLYGGPALFSSRWSGEVLAATHLITLGFVAHSVVGALLQYLPVAGNVDLRRLHRLAPWLQVPLTAGTLLLAAGFLFHWQGALRYAAWMLALALGLFVLLAAGALLPCIRGDPSLRTIMLGLGGLAVTISLGWTLATQPALAGIRAADGLSNLHAVWGMVGWISITIIGVGVTVVPMFQLTPRYPDAMAHVLPVALLGALLVLGWGSRYSSSLARMVGAAILALGVVLFAIATLRLQQAARRRGDVTVWLWRLAMVSALSAAACSAWAMAFPADAAQSRFAFLVGILILPGFAMSIINGMMYKIVPFLVWLHLQQGDTKRRPLQHMRQVIPERAMRWQAWAHAGSVLALLVTLLWEPAVYFAGVLWAASQSALAANLTRALWRYGATQR